jgi:ABC-type amino acid transport substrate-binding protein
MLIKNTERLMAEHYEPLADRKHDVEMLYTTAYAFPHAGKLLTLVFIPFVAWFFGNEMVWWEYPSFFLSGVSAYFAGPIVAVPFLLDQMQLPHDMFQLFLLTSVIGERIGDSVGAMHLATFALVTLAAMKSLSRLSIVSITKYIAAVSILGAATIGIASMTLSQMAASIESKSEVLAEMQLIQEPAQSVLLTDPGPNPVSLQPGETVMERIRRRGIMRVGYNEDKIPFAYFDEGGGLVGFDVNLAHALARDLGVSIEFVRFDRATLIEQVQADHFDFVMSGLVGTLERSEAMVHSASYMDVTLGLVVPDYRVREFESLDEIRKLEAPRIGFVDLSRGFVARLKAELPEAQLVEIENNRDFFEVDDLSLDALLISAESGSAFTLFYPEYEVAVPSDFDVKLPLFYVLAGTDNETRDFIDHWVQLRTKDGTFDAYYQHWILGRRPTTKQPRWSILRNVLHWVH